TRTPAVGQLGACWPTAGVRVVSVVARREGGCPVKTRLFDVPGVERQALAPEAAWHTLSAEEVLRAEQADPRYGLSSAEAGSRADRFGPNTLAAGRAEPRWRAFIRQYSDPMQIVLLVAGLVSLYPLNQLGTGVLLILLTLANAGLGLQQEGEAQSAVAA